MERILVLAHWNECILETQVSQLSALQVHPTRHPHTHINNKGCISVSPTGATCQPQPPVSILPRTQTPAESGMQGVRRCWTSKRRKWLDTKIWVYCTCLGDVPSTRTHLYVEDNIKSSVTPYTWGWIRSKSFLNNFNRIKNVYCFLIFSNYDPKLIKWTKVTYLPGVFRRVNLCVQHHWKLHSKIYRLNYLYKAFFEIWIKTTQDIIKGLRNNHITKCYVELFERQPRSLKYFSPAC